MKPFVVYMLECRNGSFYVGHTDDLETRIAQHATGVFGGHTAALRPVRLVWSQEFAERDEAFWVERQLKGWSRAKKRALIEGDWNRIRALAGARTGPDLRKAPARPEPVEGRADAAVPARASTGSARAEVRLGPSSPARPEPVEGRADADSREAAVHA